MPAISKPSQGTSSPHIRLADDLHEPYPCSVQVYGTSHFLSITTSHSVSLGGILLDLKLLNSDDDLILGSR